MCTPIDLSMERCDAGLTTTFCPQCGSVAEIEWAAGMSGTSGEVGLAKIRCILKHWFLMPVAA